VNSLEYPSNNAVNGAGTVVQLLVIFPWSQACSSVEQPHSLALARQASPSYALPIVKGLSLQIAAGTCSINFCPSGSSAADPGDRRTNYWQSLIGNIVDGMTRIVVSKNAFASIKGVTVCHNVRREKGNEKKRTEG
jgi:hypothetical protein